MAHDKYTNKPKYSEMTILRLSANQRHEIELLSKKYNTTFSAVVRLAIDKLIDDIYKDEAM